jgi:hypothetical protein
VDVLEAWEQHRRKVILKLSRFPAAQHRHFQRFEGTPVTVLEIGVSLGGSTFEELFPHVVYGGAYVFCRDWCSSRRASSHRRSWSAEAQASYHPIDKIIHGQDVTPHEPG